MSPALAILAAVLAAPASAAPAPADGVLPLYRMAHAYGVSAFNRSCADVSLRPGLEAARRRLEAARRRLVAAHGEDVLRHEEIPVMVPGDPCANAAAARTSAREFGNAVARLETALGQASATAPAQMNTSVAAQSAAHANMLARFLFYRLQFFHDRAARQGCVRAQPERTRALDARYDAVERRVVALSGPVSPYSGPDPRADGFDDDCRIGIVLNGYEPALHALERHLDETER